jgi:serine/threonine protein kinase
MVCGRRLSLHDAFVEVEHLQKLRHPHIIQLIGSYLQGKKFSVLLYPVADYDLGAFFDEVLPIASRVIREIDSPDILPLPAVEPPFRALWDFFSCLVDALGYLHSRKTKHLDIKPGNILVKKHSDYRNGHRVYIADFGISRSFPAVDHSQTDAHILRTPKYCAPEVWERGTHGRAADIFSMGCVFMEMLTVLCGIDLDEFSDFRSRDSEDCLPYRDSIGKVQEWGIQLEPKLLCLNQRVQQLGFPPFHFWYSRIVEVTADMLAENPEKRTIPDISRCATLLPDQRLRPEPWRCSLCYAAREVYREEP